ncbi:hypothetical protein Taro_050722 [Colocasia esculenta]|uniref:Uncharacterized protein n=1 Tax=Colocasia esculenta TaxID=4460 RepID=A0A843XET2_COLES|nr:hypothetical protein [Colocasia esculenta]
MGLQLCGLQIGRLGGPADWAQNAHKFSACERDKGLRRILNVMALVVAFLLPLFWVVVCMCAACRTLGRHADVDLVKFDQTELEYALLGQGILLRGFAGRFDGLVVLLACSPYEDVAWSRGKTE